MSQEETKSVTNDKEAQAETTSGEAGNVAEPVRDAAQDNEVAKLKQQVQEYLDGWQRERAEFANYRKRVDNQLKDSYQNASLDLLKKFLPIVDDFERAMTSVPPEIADQPWLNGITLIYRKFQKILDDYGVEAIDPVGQPFDPNRHDAMLRVEDSGLPANTIVEELRPGYCLGDRVIRPALVKVQA